MREGGEREREREREREGRRERERGREGGRADMAPLADITSVCCVYIIYT